MATNNIIRLQSVVAKSSIQPFSKPVQHPSSRAPQPSKIQSLEDHLSHINNYERLRFELERFGHFTVEEGDRWTQAEIDTAWTQAEIDTAWTRLNAAKPKQPSAVLHLSSIGTLSLILNLSTSL